MCLYYLDMYSMYILKSLYDEISKVVFGGQIVEVKTFMTSFKIYNCHSILSIPSLVGAIFNKQKCLMMK